MEINQRVKHEKFGLGTITHAMFVGTFREMYLIQFDESQEGLHDGFSFGKEKRCYWCRKKELEIVDEREVTK